MKMMKDKKIKVYLSARISKDARAWNNYVCGFLTAPFSVFMPQTHNSVPKNHKDFQIEVAYMDIDAMQQSDMGLLLPPYGRDCAWEVGWYAGQKKPLVAFTHNELEWLRDWMLKSCLAAVITDNQNTYLKLKKDPILSKKRVILIGEMNELREALMDVLEVKR
ncbi:hypothetical protein JXA85_02820 [Candidatus Woesearchaeota archaeon]|nr:hypothetical protein [Candidatus Woesearchaeota archaeon]